MTSVSIVIGILIVLYVGYRIYQYLFPPPNLSPNGKYVLISGCDTGFGHTLAIELDKIGFHVLAGVYNPDNEEHLTQQLSNRATVFCLDITRQEEIDAAYELVMKKTNSLFALVNNAGILRVGFIDWTSVETMRTVMDVNFFGHVSMTKKFLPLLISRRESRIVNVCSAAGYISLPSLSAYSTSKFAFEAFSDSLRREMRAWGLHVSIIEPGYMRTSIIEGIDHKYQEIWETLDSAVQKRWGENYFRGYVKHVTHSVLLQNAENPHKVIKALRHAVMNSVPKTRYRPGWQSSLFFFPLSMLPTSFTDFILDKAGQLDATPDGLLDQN